jgi:hypothetical protein
MRMRLCLGKIVAAAVSRDRDERRGCEYSTPAFPGGVAMCPNWNIARANRERSLSLDTSCKLSRLISTNGGVYPELVSAFDFARPSAEQLCLRR